MGEIYINSINYVVIIIAILGVYSISNKPLFTFSLILFFYFFKNFYLFVGTSFEIWKLLSIQFIVFKGTLLIKNYGIIKNKFFLNYLVFFVLVILFTIIGAFIKNDYSIYVRDGGVFKNEGRILFQISSYVITMNLILIPYLVLKTLDDLKKILLVLLKSCIVLASFGLIQFLIFNLTGNNPFPIKGSDGISHSGYILDTVFRINSMAGEPKHMGVAMVVGIIIIVLAKISQVKIIKYENFFLVLFLFNLYLTYSTTGYTLLLIVLLSSTLFASRNKTRFIFIFGILGLGISFFISNFNEQSRDTMIKQFSRASLEIQDESVKDYFLEEPIHAMSGVGLGNIHYYAVKYLPSDWPLNKDVPYKANNGFLYGISDYGLIGMIILYFSTFKLILINSKKSNFLIQKDIGKKYLTVLNALSFVVSIIFFFRYNELFFILIGCMLALNRILNEQQLLNKS